MGEPRVYEIVLSPEAEGGFSVFVPELPGCATQGETREEALEMAKEAIEGYLESLADDDVPVTVEVQPVDPGDGDFTLESPITPMDELHAADGTKPASAEDFNRLSGDLPQDGEG